MNADNSEKIIAKKYAQALLNINSMYVNYDDIKHIEKIGLIIKQDPSWGLLLKVFMLENSARKEDLLFCIRQLAFPEYMYPLIMLLIDAKRLFLLSEICHFLGIYFRQKNTIVEYHITSTLPLSTLHKEHINHFLTLHTRGSVEAIYALDQRLIAGVRMQSKTHIWEKSIAQQLREVQLKRMR